ncbi:MAG: hypothetical protein COV36_01075 [Alphaproteobacteria bacterium CG11_big_fil_rev_8_21_14_0_20_44_7]|nr:MAG: hypothetical protein COV36_01075 [Alphaproteobacteria bacterium CG11_big_fil_rev_8_21_14_0_20_44_7]
MRLANFLYRRAFVALACLGIAALVNLAAFTYPAEAKKESDNEAIYKHQSAYIYNFLSYIEWPSLVYSEEGIKNIELCIIGEDNLGKYIDYVARKALMPEAVNKKIKINVRRSVSPAEFASCNMAYISSSEEKNIKAYLFELTKYPVFTISEIDDFADMGGILEFDIRRGKQRFLINISAAKRANLKIAAELLETAAEVVEK